MLSNKARTMYNSHDYESLPVNSDTHPELAIQRPGARPYRNDHVLLTAFLMILSAAAGFAASVFLYNNPKTKYASPSEIRITDSLQPQVRLDTIARIFEHNKQFEQAPPHGPGSGNKSEPVWDSLIPKGLGYLSHPLLPTKSIPTVFHQLHCLYTIRRAYFAAAQSPQSMDSLPDDTTLQRWDLGKPRAKHVAHCFDFLQQGLTCSADSTLEPAIDLEHEFLGTGFKRQCRDFKGLKAFAEKYRIFDSEGFLAVGMKIPGARSKG